MYSFYLVDLKMHGLPHPSLAMQALHTRGALVYMQALVTCTLTDTEHKVCTGKTLG